MAATIIDNGLGDYYQHRDSYAEVANSGEGNSYTLFDQPEFQQGFVVPHVDQSALLSARISIGGISCAACVWLIEQQLNSLQGVNKAIVNLSQHRLIIDFNPDTIALSVIFQKIAAIGYHPAPFSDDGEEQMLKQENNTALRRLGIAGIGMMQVGMYAIALHAGSLQGISLEQRDFLRLVSAIVATVVVFIAAKPFFTNAWRSIKGRHLSMDVPVALAIGLAYVASCWATYQGTGEVYFDSVSMFTFFLLLGRYLEMRARHFNRRSVKGVQSSMPGFAWLVDDQGESQQIAIAQLEVGQTILVKPGEQIPADGIITQGASAVDESAFSGEYLPIDKTAGDRVIAGSMNTDNNLTIAVEAIGDASQLATINRLLDQAQQQKPAIGKLADKLSSMFVLQVLIISAAVYLFWLSYSPDDALWVALSVLVVSCPCALSLATPTSITAATASLRERGVLISRSHVLESLNNSDLVIFDKTGTLTSGRLERITTYAPQGEQQALAIAAAIEFHSNHPIAFAFQDIAFTCKASDVIITPAKGLQATIENTVYRIGTVDFVEQFCLDKHALEQAIEQQQDDTDSQFIFLASEQQFMGVFTLNDYLRPEAIDAVSQLQSLGKEVIILSGDPSNAVHSIAQQLSIKLAIGAANPADKLAYIEQQQTAGRHVIMVGDGINDVPVLAAADVSIAMTQAADLARTNADCMLLNNRLDMVPALLDTAAETKRIIRQNFAWSLGYNVLTVPIAAAGLIPPYIAAIGMSLSSLIVVCNALRLLKTKR
ncbi:Copper-exporting P-type ATPase [Sinobacterium norvegicum]|uniref:Copper-exporting P-type ATPase n=1 Tax=Sinobacterium norvegicum TaxID=1641715 RepID=A0ABM9ACA6_9GAMM|nr:Copper-exporting P-type ATPase [Sinobacterium norvegicum]